MGGSVLYTQGALDDVAIYDRALTGAEVGQIVAPVPELANIALPGISVAELTGAEAGCRRKKKEVDLS